eukprot:PhM_4_TR1315/c2_g7_i7/m.52878
MWYPCRALQKQYHQIQLATVAIVVFCVVSTCLLDISPLLSTPSGGFLSKTFTDTGERQGNMSRQSDETTATSIDSLDSQSNQTTTANRIAALQSNQSRIFVSDLSPWQPWVYNTTKCTEKQWLAREVHLNRSRVLRALRGKHIVMIGDSVTRYQYLNLVYYL